MARLPRLTLPAYTQHLVQQASTGKLPFLWKTIQWPAFGSEISRQKFVADDVLQTANSANKSLHNTA
jgi:hypothetical protein